jgi:hypothetical protein
MEEYNVNGRNDASITPHELGVRGKTIVRENIPAVKVGY